MSSYKPVIYIFVALGLLSMVGFIGLAGYGVSQMSTIERESYMEDGGEDFWSINDPSDLMNTSSSTYPSYSETRRTDPDATEIDDRSYTEGVPVMGNSVRYTTMQDDTIMMDLKIPENMSDLTLRALLTRPDTSLQELYQSDTKLALKMTALNQEKQTLLVQDLKTGEIYDTEVNLQANFKFIGPQVLHALPSPTRPDELTQLAIYNIETNETTRKPALGEGFSYAKKVDMYGPVADMSIKNFKVEVQVYSTKDTARFDTDRKPVRSEIYP
ncbi:hypothetical protein KBD34_05350 [Patescibacteria group bacterium]|nr:hypothetical protein [Patescibacteria group bacterium]